MAQLFITVGAAPAVVLEAVGLMLQHQRLDAVHVIASASKRIETSMLHQSFQAQKMEYSITRVADFSDLGTPNDHERFEEVLLRWLLHRMHPLPHAQRWVCLAGGFKTMSAAMQQAAELFGAQEIFHVLATPIFGAEEGRKREPSTAEEVEEALRRHAVHWIRLGGQTGWPQVQRLRSADYPLVLEKDDVTGELKASPAPGPSLREYVAAMRQRSIHVSHHLERLAHLPFPILASWSPQELQWLEEPLDGENDRAWVRSLPKIDLHCHLGGFATHGTDLEAVRQAACFPEKLPTQPVPEFPPGWPVPPEPITLAEYTRLGDATGTRLLRDPGCLKRHCQLLYETLAEDGTVYAEVRCSPANYATDERSPWEVLTDIRNTFQECMQDDRCHVNLILIATRRQSGNFRTHMARHISLAVTAAERWKEGCRVVGVDLAGYEDRETRPHLFREEFTAVHRCGLALTVHAGENDDAEAIWRAVFDLNARRLGHGLRLMSDDGTLLNSVVSRRIAVELCPYANYQIRHPAPNLVPQQECFACLGVPATDRMTYPLREYFRKGVAVTINTDNIGISQANLTDNWLFTARLCPGITRMELLATLRHSLEAAFIGHNERQGLLEKISHHLNPPWSTP